LPVHVDARFLATICQTGLDFSLSYNALLLDAAADLFGEFLAELRKSPKLEDRSAATRNRSSEWTGARNVMPYGSGVSRL